MNLIKEQVALRGVIHKVFRSKGGLWFPWCDAFVPRHHNCLAVLRTPNGKIIIPGHNIVTDRGDIHYAERGAAATPADLWTRMVMATAGTPSKGANRASFTEVAASIKVFDTGFPKTNDPDADNTGAGPDIVTWLTSYTKTDFNANNITHALIIEDVDSTDPILTGFAWAASFNKTADDTLKAFVNHQFDGQ